MKKTKKKLYRVYWEDKGSKTKESSLATPVINQQGEECYLLANGNIKYEEGLMSKTSTRNVPEELKEALVKVAETKDSISEIKLKISELESQLRALYREEVRNLNNLVATNNKVLGLLSVEEFAAEFIKNLPSFIGNRLKEYEVHSQNGRNINDPIYFMKSVDVEKWYNGPMVYNEYDNTLHFVSNYKEMNEYKSIVKRYGKKISGLNLEFYEDLSLGDKWLYYNAEYIIRPKKKLTKEYAKELAKKALK